MAVPHVPTVLAVPHVPRGSGTEDPTAMFSRGNDHRLVQEVGGIKAFARAKSTWLCWQCGVIIQLSDKPYLTAVGRAATHSTMAAYHHSPGHNELSLCAWPGRQQVGLDRWGRT